MKQLLCLISFVFIAVIYCGASQVAGIDPQKHPRRQDEKHLPDEQEPNLDGVVEVSFRLDSEGKVQILNINSTSPQLSDYVIKKLNRIQLDGSNSELGKIIKYRFVFKKQA
jgi:hypothetical protein